MKEVVSVGIDCKLDWLNFTYRSEVIPEYDAYGSKGSIFTAFQRDFPELEKLLDGAIWLSKESKQCKCYDFGFCCSENIFVLYDDLENSRFKSLNVQIPSHALGLFMQHMRINDVSELLKVLQDRGCVPSRIDIAFDDYEKTFRPHQYFVWWAMDMFSTHTRLVHFICNKDSGDTFYMGRRGKDRFLRIYDKFAESNGEIDSVRYEWEFHDNGAKKIWQLIIEDGGLNFAGLLLNHFRILDPEDKNFSNDHDKQRCATLPVWQELLDKSQLYRIVMPKLQRGSTIASVEKHINSIKQNLAVYVSVFGFDSLDQLIMNCVIDQKHKCLIRDGKELRDFIRCKPEDVPF